MQWAINPWHLPHIRTRRKIPYKDHPLPKTRRDFRGGSEAVYSRYYNSISTIIEPPWMYFSCIKKPLKTPKQSERLTSLKLFLSMFPQDILRNLKSRLLLRDSRPCFVCCVYEHSFTFLFSLIEPKKLVIQELMSGRIRETSWLNERT